MMGCWQTKAIRGRYAKQYADNMSDDNNRTRKHLLKKIKKTYDIPSHEVRDVYYSLRTSFVFKDMTTNAMS